jgi:Eukaryotic aspartyl protease
VFSFNLGGTDETSSVIFGGYDLQKYAKDPIEPIIWNQLKEDNYWTLEVREAKLGSYTFDLDTHSAIIDTGTSYILMPSNDFEEFRSQVEPGRTCYFDKGKTDLFVCTCLTDTHNDFPAFHIKLG